MAGKPARITGITRLLAEAKALRKEIARMERQLVALDKRLQRSLAR